jgi:hypothetical protein
MNPSVDRLLRSSKVFYAFLRLLGARALVPGRRHQALTP